MDRKKLFYQNSGMKDMTLNFKDVANVTNKIYNYVMKMQINLLQTLNFRFRGGRISYNGWRLNASFFIFVSECLFIDT